jgi:hypothetical protein
MLRHPYRTTSPPVAAEQPREPRSFDLDAEIVILVVCAVGIALGLSHRRFGSTETLALLGLVFAAREIARRMLRR